MKKTLIVITTFIVLSLFSGVSAKSGDIEGIYYSTDIKTYLNGEEINAINIGGKTLINAEVMHEYGFGVNWSQTDRTLKVYERKTFEKSDFVYKSVSELPSGTPMGYYYETDIITYLDGSPITAYNTCGQTYIDAESMSNFGYKVKWYSKERKLDIVSPICGGYVYDIAILEGKKQEKEAEGWFLVKYKKDETSFEGDGEYFSLDMHASAKGYNFTVAFYQNAGLYYSSKLLENLKKLCYDGYGVENACEKSEKYELVNKNVTILINGLKASKVSVTGGAGNGHRDFEFNVEDLPKLNLDEIYEIVFQLNM